MKTTRATSKRPRCQAGLLLALQTIYCLLSQASTIGPNGYPYPYYNPTSPPKRPGTPPSPSGPLASPFNATPSPGLPPSLQKDTVQFNTAAPPVMPPSSIAPSSNAAPINGLVTVPAGGVPPATGDYRTADGLHVIRSANLPDHLDSEFTMWIPPTTTQSPNLSLNDYPVKGVNPFDVFKTAQMTPQQAQTMAEQGKFDEVHQDRWHEFLHHTAEPAWNNFNAIIAKASAPMQEIGAAFVALSIVQDAASIAAGQKLPIGLRWVEKLAKNQKGEYAIAIVQRTLEKPLMKKMLGGTMREAGTKIWNVIVIPKGITGIMLGMGLNQPTIVLSNLIKMWNKGSTLLPGAKAASSHSLFMQEAIGIVTGSLFLIGLTNTIRAQNLRDSVSHDLERDLRHATDYDQIAKTIRFYDKKLKYVEENEVTKYISKSKLEGYRPSVIMGQVERTFVDPFKNLFLPSAEIKQRRHEFWRDIKTGLAYETKDKQGLDKIKTALKYLGEEKALSASADAYGLATLALTASGTFNIMKLPNSYVVGARAAAEGIGMAADASMGLDDIFAKGHPGRGALLIVGNAFERKSNVKMWSIDSKDPRYMQERLYREALGKGATDLVWGLKAIEEGAKKKANGGLNVLLPEAVHLPHGTQVYKHPEHTKEYHDKYKVPLPAGAVVVAELPAALKAEALGFEYKARLTKRIDHVNKQRGREGVPPLDVEKIYSAIQRQANEEVAVNQYTSALKEGVAGAPPGQRPTPAFQANSSTTPASDALPTPLPAAVPPSLPPASPFTASPRFKATAPASETNPDALPSTAPVTPFAGAAQSMKPTFSIHDCAFDSQKLLDNGTLPTHLAN
jgi:hypothetical protein